MGGYVSVLQVAAAGSGAPHFVPMSKQCGLCKRQHVCEVGVPAPEAHMCQLHLQHVRVLL